MKIDDDAPLNRYLLQHLQPLTNADPTLLANYVTALLKNNKPQKDLQKLCIEQLYDFLGEGTKGFVIKLFHALEEGSVKASQGEKETLSHITPVSLIDDVRESRVSPISRYEKAPSLTAQAESDQDDGTDDEDDDRNHKHKRRITKSRSFERDDQDDEDGGVGNVDDTARGPHKMHNRLTQVQQLQGNDDQSIAVLLQGCSTGIMEREASLKSDRCTIAARSNAEGNRRGVSRGNRSDAPVPRYHNQNGILCGPLGRFGVNNGSRSSNKQRYHPFDGPNFNDSLLTPGPPNIFPGRAVPTRGNSPHVPWVGFGHISGMGNGPLDQLIPLNAAIQGGRAVPISHSIGVGINMGMGMSIGRHRCPDFEERGYCLRGDLCPMEHGANRIVVEDVQSLSQFNLPVALPTGWGIGTGSTPLLAPASVSTSSFAMVNRTSRELINKYRVSNGTVPSTVIAEPDLYDPDQPLWNKDCLVAGAGMRLLPPFKKGQDDQDWESAVLKHGGQRTSDGVESDRNAQIPAGLSVGQVESSVWKHIGPLEWNENMGEVVSGISTTSGEEPYHGKISRKDSSEDHHGKIKVGRGKKLENEFQFQSDFDDAIKATPANSSSHGKQMSGMHEESAFHHEDVKNHGTIPGAHRANSGSSHERAQRTLYVSCIPVDSNRKELLLEHFQKFGDILDIHIPLHSNRAFVQFLRPEDAEAALLSPEAVVGNRFIRLAWANHDSISDPGEAKVLLLLNEHPTISGPNVQTQASIAEKALCLPDTCAMENAGELTGVHAQPSRVSMVKKKQEELNQMKEEIRRKQQELAEKRYEFCRKLDRLSHQGTATKNDSNPEHSSKRSKSEERESSINTLSNASCLGAAPVPAATESGLSSEQSISISAVQKLSTDATKPACGPFLSSSCQLSSLRFPFATQSLIWGPARYKLDNRTTVFRVLPPIPDVFADIGSLREHFTSFGDLSNIELEDPEGQKQECSKITQKSVVRVTFANRWSAERAFIQGRWFQGSLLQLVWFPVVNAPGVMALTKSRHPESTCKSRKSPQTVGHCLDGIPSVEGQLQKEKDDACGDGVRSEDTSTDKSVITEAKFVNPDER